eukprot:m.46660 g.46660  ORF g.46660 m.46660 type:complete len:495 (+) comp47445_c0_seq1:1145-2629(+)
MVLELLGAERMRDVLDGVADRVSEVVGRVDTPIVASAVVRGELDAESNRIDLSVLHDVLQPQGGLVLVNLALAHILEEAQGLLNWALAPRRERSRAGIVSLQLFDSLMADVRVTALDHLNTVIVEFAEVVRCVGDLVRLVAQPSHRLLDSNEEALLLLFGICVVVPKDGDASAIAGVCEVEIDGLRVPDVQHTVGFGRETRANLPTRLFQVLLQQGHGVRCHDIPLGFVVVTRLVERLRNTTSHNLRAIRGRLRDIGCRCLGRSLLGCLCRSRVSLRLGTKQRQDLLVDFVLGKCSIDPLALGKHVAQKNAGRKLVTLLKELGLVLLNHLANKLDRLGLGNLDTKTSGIAESLGAQGALQVLQASFQLDFGLELLVANQANNEVHKLTDPCIAAQVPGKLVQQVPLSLLGRRSITLDQVLQICRQVLVLQGLLCLRLALADCNKKSLGGLACAVLGSCWCGGSRAGWVQDAVGVRSVGVQGKVLLSASCAQRHP